MTDQHGMVNSMSTFTDKQGQSSPVSPTVGYNAEQPQQQQDTMLKGNYCAIYEATAPRGCKFKIFNGPGKKDRESDGLVAKLNVGIPTSWYENLYLK